LQRQLNAHLSLVDEPSSQVVAGLIDAEPDQLSSQERSVHALHTDGAILDWLVAPAFTQAVRDLADVVNMDGSPWAEDERQLGRWRLTNGPDVTPIKRALYERNRLDGTHPSGTARVGAPFEFAGQRGVWQRHHCAPDGLLDWSEFCFSPSYRLGLATALIEVDQAAPRYLEISSTGPWQAFLDGTLIAENDAITYMDPLAQISWAEFGSGLHRLDLVSWQVGFRECRHIMRVRIGGLPVRVVVPEAGADERACEWGERLLDQIGLVRWASIEPVALLSGPAGLAVRVSRGPVEVRGVLDERPTAFNLYQADPHSAGMPAAFARHEDVVVRLDDDRVPLSRSFPMTVLPADFRDWPGSDEPDSWRTSLLAQAATRDDVAGALAAVNLGQQIRAEQLEQGLKMLDVRADCADFQALGLLNLLRRSQSQHWPDGLRDRVEHALLNLKYWIDEPGLDAMCFFTENHQLVWHSCEYLAGLIFPDRVFCNDGRSGAEHAEHGRDLALEWLRRRLAGGFAEFDSNSYLAIDVLSLVSLVEFGTDQELVGLARALADRCLFTLALNTWRGSFATAHGRSYAVSLRTSRFEEAAALSWVAFGSGAIGDMLLPAAVLATAKRYQVPELARRLAAAKNRHDWTVQRSHGEQRFQHDLLSRDWDVTSVVYRTPHVVLSSAQDYRSGLPGLQEHTWGATLGPEAQIFVTHPPNCSIDGSSRPNQWAGNRVLPRVRQHREVLLVVHHWPIDDPMGYTHAWFPTAHLDEWTSHGDWLAARVGDGYVAIGAPGGLRLAVSGPNAQSEVRTKRSERSAGGSCWACIVGSGDGATGFHGFVHELPELGGQFGERIELRWEGHDYELSWTGPFLIDGRSPDLVDGKITAPDLLMSNFTRTEADELIYQLGEDEYRIPLR